MTATASGGADALALFGTPQAVAVAHRLVAGGWCCDLVDGGLRDLRWHGVEVVRGIAYLLRDSDWGTVPATVSGLQVDAQADTFHVRFQLEMATAEGRLQALAEIIGRADGTLDFDVQARANAPLRTNRCGFVVLHPAALAGCALTVLHTNGRQTQTSFPRTISPGQPVFDIRSLRHEAAPGLVIGLHLVAELPGDPAGKFEMEDQRNWSDASFKTYVGSLLDPWPSVLPAQRTLAQRVTVFASGQPMQPAAPADALTTLALGPALAACLPAIGVGVPMGLAQALPEELAALRALGAAWWIAELDLRAPDAAGQARALATARSGLAVRLQLDLIAPDAWPADVAAREAAALCQAAGLQPDALRLLPAALLKSHQPSDRWPEVPDSTACAAALRRAFPGAQVGGGVYTSFTELNRLRPSGAGLDFIGHLTCPIVHAADDAAVMQTLEALPHIAHSVGQLWPGLAYRLGPSTLAPRRNPYGAGTVPNPGGGRVALADSDPRHDAAFGAAWVAAYACVAAAWPLEVLALLESHGPNGPFGRRLPPASLARADGGPAMTVPCWQALATLAAAGGAQRVSLSGLGEHTGDGLHGLAWTHDGSTVHSLLVNAGPQPRTFRWSDEPDRAQVLAPFELRCRSHTPR